MKRPDVFTLSPVPMAINDLDGRCVDINPAALALFGRTREEVLGHTAQEVGLVSPERELSVMVNPIEIDGQRCSLSTFFDLTAQRRAEEAVRRIEARLEETHALAHLGSWEWNLETDVVLRSRELCRIFGHAYEELGASTSSSYERVHPDDRERLKAQIEQARRRGGPWEVEYRIVRPDGVRHLVARGETVMSADGRPLRAFGTAQDITERHELEMRLRRSDRLASLGTLAGGAAHEINNPLTSVTANLDIIMSELKALANDTRPATRLAALQTMAEEAHLGAQRVAKIVRDLSFFSQIEQNRRTPLALAPILERALDVAQTEGRYRAQLLKSLGETPLVEADEAGLFQVFLNLLINAAHAIPQGQAERHQISIVSRTDAAGRAVIEIRDTGKGIAPELLSRIFDPFFTTKGVGAGRGLGLSVCHGIVHSLGGEIAIESELGKGTVARVSLPPAPRAAGVAAAPTERHGRVLVVDDEAQVGTVIGRVLREHEVTVVLSGQEALDRITSGQKFDAILCDVMMPQMTGPALHAKLSRMFPQLADHLIFMTGGTFTPAETAYLDRVPNPRMPKPFAPRELRELVQRALG